jgi:hypothetical protein
MEAQPTLLAQVSPRPMHRQYNTHKDVLLYTPQERKRSFQDIVYIYCILVNT